MTRLTLALTTCAVALLAACSREASVPRPAGAAPRGEWHPVKLSTLSEAERRHGVSPTLNDEVTYQPDVVVVENGAAIVRGLGDDGVTWRIAADAAPSIEVGKVVFLTSRAVGRVLQVTRTGDELALMLGPIELTELIRDCDLSMDAPVDFGEALTYTLPEMPGQTSAYESMAARDPLPSLLPARYTDLAWSPDDSQPSLLRTQTGRIEPFVTNPIASDDGLGLSLEKEQNGVQIKGHAKLKVQSPRLRIQLIISKGEVMVAKLDVAGLAGLSLGFAAVNTVGKTGNINERYIVPADTSIPIGGALPITITIRHQFIVQTWFNSTGMLKATGDYQFGGSLGVGYSKPDWIIGAPSRVSGLPSLQKSVEGSMAGVGGISFTHQVKVIGGIGAFNFVVGPYVFLNSNVNVARHSDLDAIARCVYTGFNLAAGVGVGYVIPQPIVSFINALLRTLNLREIKGDGGLESPDKKMLINANDVRPRSQACENEKTSPPQA